MVNVTLLLMFYQNTFQTLESPSRTLLSCCAYTDKEKAAFPKHCHSYYEITYIIKGSRYETINQNKYKVDSNSIIFIPPLAIHSLKNITPVDDLVIQFDHLFIRNSSVLFENNFMLRPAEGHEKFIKLSKTDKLCRIFLSIYDYCKKRDNLPNDELSQTEKLKIDLKLNSLCLEIITVLIDENKLFIDKNSAVYTDIEKINNLIGNIIANPRESIPMDEACRIAGMSYAHFSRFFKKTTGFNYINFCNLLRIRHAEELLLTTEMPAYEIAENVGLKTLEYFTKLFKQINGNTPGNYRKKNRI